MNKQTKTLAIARLQRLGVAISEKPTDTEVTAAVRTVWRGSVADFVSNKATPAEPPKRKAYKPSVHLRQADIDAHPKQVSMGGIGIGTEGAFGYGRGR
jgi:hypothetical protein